MLPGLGSLTNSGSMPISGGHAGPSSAGSHTRAGQSIGGINMGNGVNPLLIGVVVLVLAFWVLKK